MKKLFAFFVFILALAGCAADSVFRPEPLTSPALTAEETAAVKASRVAHGALREAAGALDLAYQYISRKTIPCQNVASTQCVELKRKLTNLHARVHEREIELDRARQLVNLGDLATGKTNAENIRTVLILLQQEINSTN